MADRSGTTTEGHGRRRLPFDVTGKSVALVLGVVACVWLFIQLWPVLLTIVVALMIVGMLSPFVTRLESRGWSRRLAIAAVFFALFACVAAFVALTIPRFLAQAGDLLDKFPEMQARVVHELEGSRL